MNYFRVPKRRRIQNVHQGKSRFRVLLANSGNAQKMNFAFVFYHESSITSTQGNEIRFRVPSRRPRVHNTKNKTKRCNAKVLRNTLKTQYNQSNRRSRPQTSSALALPFVSGTRILTKMPPRTASPANRKYTHPALPRALFKAVLTSGKN